MRSILTIVGRFIACLNWRCGAQIVDRQRPAMATFGLMLVLVMGFSSQARAQLPNDNFADAIVVFAPGAVDGTTLGASGESGEPETIFDGGFANAPLNSVWYSWTPTEDETATFDTCSGTTYDTTLVAFTGAAVDALTEIAQNNEFCATQSSITFLAIAGTTYYIQVDGYVENTGNFTLTYSSAAPDTTPPVLAEVTPVPTPTDDSTPDYTFSSDEAGAISYGGDCSSAAAAAVIGNNPVTFNALAAGLHDNCTITVTDAVGNVSVLAVSAFTIKLGGVGTGLTVRGASSGIDCVDNIIAGFAASSSGCSSETGSVPPPGP